MTKKILKRCPCPTHAGKRRLPPTPEFWFRSKGAKDGFAGYCKKCHYAAVLKAQSKRRAAGLCVRCGAPASPTRRSGLCDGCGVKAAAAVRKTQSKAL
jgi:hypothetical protein